MFGTIGFVIPEGVSPLEVAETFAAYISLGSQKFQVATLDLKEKHWEGPFPLDDGLNRLWNLDELGCYVLYVNDEATRAHVNYRYDYQGIRVHAVIRSIAEGRRCWTSAKTASAAPL